MRVHQTHQVDLLAHVNLKIFFGEAKSAQHRLPSRIGGPLWILFTRFSYPSRRFQLSRVLKLSRFHLAPQKFLVDQTIKHSAAVLGAELSWGATRQQGFIAKPPLPPPLHHHTPPHLTDTP